MTDEQLTVACLYVDPRGPYPTLPGTDCWDESRDARLYDGPHPVVAHPPCGNWTPSAALRAYYSRDDADCAVRAVEQVRRWGGVLEHPAHSRLWPAMQLALPCGLPDAHGFAIAINPVDWGHVAVKPTWLYVVGTSWRDLPPMPAPRQPTHVVSGGKWTGGRKVCSAQQRRRTPRPFAEWLLSIARSVQ